MTAQSAPTDAAAAAFSAMARKDWRSLAMLVHPSALDSVRQDALGMLILRAERRAVGEEEGGGYNPNEVAIAARVTAVSSVRARQFGPEATLGELAGLDPRAFFVRWCRAVYGPDAPGYQSDAADRARQIVGAVAQGDSIAYVVYRREHREIDEGELIVERPGRALVMPLEQHQGRWLLLLNDDIGWVIDFMGTLHERMPSFQAPRRRTVREAPAAATPRYAAAVPDPSQVMAAVFAAAEQRDWRAVARLVEADRLIRLRDQELAMIATMVSARQGRRYEATGGTVAMVFTMPDRPDSAALARVDTVKLSAASGAPTIGEVARLSPPDFFVRLAELAYGRGPVQPGDEPDRRIVLGHVFDGPDRAHVLYAFPARYPGARGVQHITVRHTAGGWRTLLDGNDLWSSSWISMMLLRP